ncbi:MAG: hypothetical protein LBR51_02610 [Bacteroidales bacterium]|jgi:hypothetical protein|nr:hypothetical protein [Bacteroidales bacterium]
MKQNLKKNFNHVRDLRDIHLENLVKTVLDREDHTLLWLARELNIDYSSLCKTMKKNHIPVPLLWQISVLLRVNLFSVYFYPLEDMFASGEKKHD